MTERARTLKVGGILLTVVIAGLIVGFVLLRDGNSKPTVTPSTSSSGDVKTQVEQAYLREWDVYADALLKLDTSRLSEALADAALRTVTQQVDTQRAKNQPARVRVEHDYTIHIVNDTTATIDDTYINHTVRLDPKTMQPIEKDPKERVHSSYTLKKVSGTWKVTEIIEYR